MVDIDLFSSKGTGGLSTRYSEVLSDLLTVRLTLRLRLNQIGHLQLKLEGQTLLLEQVNSRLVFHTSLDVPANILCLSRRLDSFAKARARILFSSSFCSFPWGSVPSFY